MSLPWTSVRTVSLSCFVLLLTAGPIKRVSVAESPVEAPSESRKFYFAEMPGPAPAAFESRSSPVMVAEETAGAKVEQRIAAEGAKGGHLEEGRLPMAMMSRTPNRAAGDAPHLATVLTSGVPYNFSVPPVSSPTLLSVTAAYQIAVPQNATRLEVKTVSTTPGADLDLYVRFGMPPSVENGRVVADHRSELGNTGNETIVVTASSSPPLRAGTYYITLSMYSTEIAAYGSVTATVTAPTTPPPPVAPPPPGTKGLVLSSGVPYNFSVRPVSAPTLLTEDGAFQITVPQNGVRLEVKTAITTSGADLDLFVRFGSPPAVEGGRVVSDYKSDLPNTGNESVVVTSSSTPPLKAGTYFITLALYSPGVAVYGTLTATVTTGTAQPPPRSNPPPPTGGALTSGVPSSFSLPAVTSPTLMSESGSFQIAVPEGATRLEVKTVTTTPGADVDLFVRYGVPPVVEGGRVVCDHQSDLTDTGDETVVVTPDSSPPLRAGTYYITLGLYSTGVAAGGAITATVWTGGGPEPSPDGVVLVSGVPSGFSLPEVSGPTLMSLSGAFQITVPQGATRLEVKTVTTTPGADVDLYVRYGSRPEVDDAGRVVCDYKSDMLDTGDETVVVTADSSPPLRPGIYYITLGLYTSGLAANGTVTATVSSDVSRPPVSGGGAVLLTSGAAAGFSLPAVNAPTLMTQTGAFRIVVPTGATRLEVRTVTTTSGADVDLWVRYGSPPTIEGGRVIYDHKSDLENTGNETVLVTLDSSPPLRAGTYYITLSLYSTGIAASGTVTATVYSDPSRPPLTGGTGTVLTSGVPANFSLAAVDSPTLMAQSGAFRIEVPAGSTRLEIRTITTSAGVDVDLWVRYGSPPTIENGRVVYDYKSDLVDTGNETVVVTPASSPPLKAGTYYITLSLYSTGRSATGTVTATVTR